MKKKQIQLVCLLAVLVVLVGGYFGLRQYNKSQANQPESGGDGEQIMSLALDDIVKLSYDYEDNIYSYEKIDGTWYYTQNQDLNINQSRIENMLSNVVTLTAVETIPDVTDMAQYGLALPTRSFTIESQNESHIFHVGDYNSTNSVYYICRPSETTVYVVSATTVNGFNVKVEDIVEEESVEEEDSQEVENETESTPAEQESEAGSTGTEPGSEAESTGTTEPGETESTGTEPGSEAERPVQSRE